MPDQVNTPVVPDPNQKYKIKVGEKEIELTYDQLVERAQKGEDYTQKTQKFAETQRAFEEEKKKLGEWGKVITKVDSDPKLRDTLSKVMSDYESGKTSTSEATKDRNLKLLDKRIENAENSETRETLQELRKIISEETNIRSLEEKVAYLEQELAVQRSNTALSINDRIDKQLSDVSDLYGEIVEKYKSDIKASASRFPNQSVEQLFFYFASRDDKEKAVLHKIEQEKKKEETRKKAGSSQSTETIKTRIEPPRDKKGRVDWRAWTKKMQEAGRFG